MKDPQDPIFVEPRREDRFINRPPFMRLAEPQRDLLAAIASAMQESNQRALRTLIPYTLTLGVSIRHIGSALFDGFNRGAWPESREAKPTPTNGSKERGF